MRTLVFTVALLALIQPACSSPGDDSPGTGMESAGWSALPSDEASSGPTAPTAGGPGPASSPSNTGDGVRSDGRAVGGETSDGGLWGSYGDPFAAQAEPAVALTNVSTSLNDVLENGDLEGACDRYANDPSNEVEKLLCGKWMFFYEGFGTSGVPKPLVDFLLKHFQEELGIGFSKLGLVADPSSEAGYPLGMAPNEEETHISFTCASCHFAPLPDGRFSVGAPNLDYEYGLHTLTFSAFPLVVVNGMGGLGLGQPVHPDALERIQPLVDKMDASWGLKAQFMMNMMSLMGQELPEFPEEQQAQYARWLPGTMDFIASPLPLDDGVDVVSKISAIYGIPTSEEGEEAGMLHAMLGSAGNTQTTEGFLELFVDFGGGEPSAWDSEDFEPLLAYIESLRPPKPPQQPEELVEAGEQVFVEAGCVDCHQGPRGSGVRLFSFEEIGTDDALKQWMDPGLTGEPCCEKGLEDHPLTYSLKSPRLVGLWAMERFLHNGSVGSLDELLCLGPATTPIDEIAYGNGGHEFGCDLSTEDKVALITYLESH